MHTPVGGHRITQWVIQYRQTPTEEALVKEWQRALIPADLTSGPLVRQALSMLRDGDAGFEFRAVRVETVQRVEDW